jgi:hypothetical protein
MDAAKILDSIDKRLHTLEQTISNPNAVVPPGGSPAFTSVIIGGVAITATNPSAVQNIVLTSGASFDVVYINVDWDAPLVGTSDVIDYEVEIAKKVTGVYQLGQIARTAGSNFRFEPVEPDTTYGIRITPINRIGNQGTTSGWNDITTGHDLTAPPAVSGVTAFRGATSVIVKFTGLTQAQARDVAYGEGLYEIEVDTSLAFNTANKRTMRSSATIVAFNDIITEGTWYGRVAAIDSSGNQGPWTASASAVAGGVNDSMVIADLNAAKIQFGVMSGDRIDVNTLNVNRLLDASTILAKTINIGAGGQFKIGNPTGGAGTSGIFINDQGIRLYQAGTPTVILDATTGVGTFTGTVNATGGTFSGTVTGGIFTGGTFQTATSGVRTDIGPGFGGIQLYTGIAGESVPGRIIAVNASGRGAVRIEGPRISNVNAPQPYIDFIGGTGTQGDIQMFANTQIYLQSAAVSIVGQLALNDYAIRFRAATDASHRIYYSSGADGPLYEGNTSHQFYTGGSFRGKFYASGFYVQDYIYAYGGTVRMGEIYGNTGLYTTSGSLRLDGNTWSVVISNANVAGFEVSSNGYNYSWQAMSMTRDSLYWKDAGDTVHRSYWHSGDDGVRHESYSYTAITSAAWDVSIEAGRYHDGFGVGAARHVNQASTAWRNSHAGVHVDQSDPRLKRNIEPLKASAGRQLDKVKAITPIKFKWRPGENSDSDRDNFGFDATTLPPEVVHRTMLKSNTNDKEVFETKGVQPLGVLAILWQAVRELSEEVDALKKKAA